MKKQFIEHEKDYLIKDLWGACMMMLPSWLDISHYQEAKDLHKDNYKITRNFVKKRLAYYRKHRETFCDCDDFYISDFDIYFKPKKFFNSHWVKKEIKELNIRQEIKQ